MATYCSDSFPLLEDEAPLAATIGQLNVGEGGVASVGAEPERELDDGLQGWVDAVELVTQRPIRNSITILNIAFFATTF